MLRVNLVRRLPGIRTRGAAPARSRRRRDREQRLHDGVRATRGEAAYSAAKAGVIALTQGAALEYAPEIRVNCVSPGMIRTPLTELLFRSEGLLDPVMRATPLGRTGTADEVADAILFLCSDLSRFARHNLIGTPCSPCRSGHRRAARGLRADRWLNAAACPRHPAGSG